MGGFVDFLKQFNEQELSHIPNRYSLESEFVSLHDTRAGDLSSVLRGTNLQLSPIDQNETMAVDEMSFALNNFLGDVDRIKSELAAIKSATYANN